MKTRFVAPLCALLLASPFCAAHATSEIAFAVPGEGLVTLGVFDKSGRLVRTLHALEPGENFRMGLNGLITAWDGADNAGEPLPEGHYHIRGYLVPELPVEGVAYHFNDWLAESNAPAISWIEDVAVLPDNGLLLGGRTPHGTLVCARHEEERGFVWSTTVEGTPPLRMAPLDRLALLKSASSWHSLALADGSATGEAPPAVDPALVTAFTPCGGSALLALGDRLEIFPAAEPSLPDPSTTFSSLAALESGIAGASDDGCFISSNSGPFQKIPLPVRVTSLSPGSGTTFWFTGTAMDSDETPLVAESDTSGEILRLLSSDPDSPPPVLVRSLPDGTGIVVLAHSNSTQTLRLIRKTLDTGWTTEWERIIQKAPSFGFLNGSVVADASESPGNKSLRIRLAENPLTGEHGEIALAVTHDKEGSFLSSEDGLPLVRISERGDITRIGLDRGPRPDSARVLQGNGAGAEEFLIQDLGKIIPLNVGGIEIP